MNAVVKFVTSSGLKKVTQSIREFTKNVAAILFIYSRNELGSTAYLLTFFYSILFHYRHNGNF